MARRTAMTKLAALSAVGVLTAGLALLAPLEAGAAQPRATYPPSTTTTTTVPATTTVPTIPVPAGNTETYTFGGYQPNTPVQCVINGTPCGTFTSDPNGNITINVVNNGDGTYSINGGPRIRFNTQNGELEVTVAGTGADGKPLDQKVIFVLASDGTVVPSGDGGGLAFTGAQIALMAGAGGILVAGGLAVVIVARRRRSSNS